MGISAAAGAALASGVAGAASGALGGGPKSTRKSKVPLFIEQGSKEATDLAVNAADQEGPEPVQVPESLQLGFDRAQSAAQGFGQDFGQPAIELGRQTLEGDFLRPESNPFLRANIEAAQEPVIEQFQNEIMPEISGNAVAAGQVGSSRQGVAQGLAAEGVTEELGNIATRMQAENFARERELQARAPQLMRQAIGLRVAPADILRTVGQEELALARSQQDRQRRSPVDLQRAQQLANVLGTLPFGRTVTQKTETDPLTGAIKGGLGGAAMGARIGGSF